MSTESQTYYHGSPKDDLQTLRPGSYVTPDLETAKLMGRFHTDTGKTWSDDDLSEPHFFGEQPKWKPGREPKGDAVIYKLQAAIKKLNTLDNPYEHTTLEELPVEKLADQDDLAAKFQPDYTPEQLEDMGVYDALYRGKGPRLASLGEWKPDWISEHDPQGWAQWYKRYSGGRRIPDEDTRQIKRWMNFKSRHGGPFSKNPTPRRGWALRNWGIDPSKLVAPDQSEAVAKLLDEYQQRKQLQYARRSASPSILDNSQDKTAQAQRGDVFSVSCHERIPEAEPSQGVRVAPAFLKQADLLPDVQLQDHQQRIADRLTSDDPRLLVYHGLGSGKSLSAIAAAEAAKKMYGDDYGVVVPASLRGNFQKEVKKFTTGSDPEIMSYTGLGMGKKFKTPPDTLIMDEAARLRNPQAASTRAATDAARQAKRLMLLTGTPITNEPSDLASLVSMLNNKPISPENFEEKFVGYKRVGPGWLGWLRGAQSGEKAYVKNEKELRNLLRGKIDYQPSKTPEGVDVDEKTVRIPLSAAQQKIQNAIRTKIPPGFLWKLDQEFPLSRDELSKLNSFLTGLRQVSLSTQPFRSDKDYLKAFDQSSKLQKAHEDLQQTLQSDPRKKAIIYSNFIDSGLKPYAAALDRSKIPYGIFHGSIPVKTRLQALKDYNEGRLRALLLGPAAAEGISTKGTSLIQLLDPHWNEARSQQARGRGLRFDSHVGLPEDLKNVIVRRYLTESQEPGLIGKYLLGQQRQRTGDEVLERLTAEKEQINEAFRRILREEGTPPPKQQDETAVKTSSILDDEADLITISPPAEAWLKAQYCA